MRWQDVSRETDLTKPATFQKAGLVLVVSADGYETPRVSMRGPRLSSEGPFVGEGTARRKSRENKRGQNCSRQIQMFYSVTFGLGETLTVVAK